jgi:hypothetical protein
VGGNKKKRVVKIVINVQRPETKIELGCENVYATNLANKQNP